jgi:beta-glucosidase-like glycosyl hydrolase
MGFQGLVFSDDLSMAAARVIDGQPVSYTTAALAALQAGLRHGAAVQPVTGRRGRGGG